MKKVTVLVAALVLLAGPAFAGSIVDSVHNLMSGSSDTNYLGSIGTNGGYDEICVYCHTPHGATAAGTAPLWNRGTPTTISSVYNNSSLDANPTVAIAQTSDAPLCLTCHSDTGLGTALNNPPNSGGSLVLTDFGAVDLSIGGSNGDLSNDHPVGFVYAAGDVELYNAVVTARASFGTGGNEFWCSSCHDVHSDDYGLFLFTSNKASALCLKCHNK